MPAAPSSTAEVFDLVRKSGIVPPDRLAAAVPDPDALPPHPQQAVGVLVQKGLVTRFQAQQILLGRHRGFRLGAYLILDQLGRGGMGAVYLAEHTELHRKVAVKVLVPGKGDDQKLATERFLREARAAAALDHPNIVRIFDVSRANDVPFLVMEYVDGETLQQTIDRDGAMPYTAAADVIAQAAAGLQHAHEKGFVHRDIKPANLIRDRSGTVKILDMGLARSAADPRDRLTERLDAGAVVGTADFIAPEQAVNGPQVDGRADIYSLGATFFSLVTGKPPFDGNTAQKLIKHQVASAPYLSQIDASLPKGLAAVVAKMLSKKPEDRYQTPAEVIGALTPWLGNSVRVMAGLSKTSLGQGADLHARLNDLARAANSNKHGVVSLDPGKVDSDALDPALAAAETAAVAAARTARSPVPAPAAKSTAPRLVRPSGELTLKKKVLLAAGGVLAVLMGILAAWLMVGRDRPPADPPAPESARDATPPAITTPVTAPVPNPAPAPAKEPATAPTPVPNPPTPKPPVTARIDPPAGERVLARLDLTGQKAFSIRSAVEVKADKSKVAKLLSRTGPGEPPAGWTGRVWHAEGQMEFFADATRGGMALAIRNVRGPQGSAMLFMPRFDCPTGVCRLRFEYSAPLRDRQFSVRFKASDSRPAWDVVRPEVTGEGWRTEEVVADLKGATGGFFEFHNNDASPDAVLRIRGVVVTEVPAGTAPTAGAAAPAAPAPDVWREGAVVYRLDVAGIAPFRVTKEGGKRVAGEPERLPTGVKCHFWKPEATGEFRCETVGGGPALGVTNFSNEKSGQIALELEREMGLSLVPGKTYRAKIGFMTRNEATGNMTVQTYEYKGAGSAKLANADGRWQTAAVTFERTEGVPLRLTVDNTSVGEGNILYVRSVELVEVERN